MPNSRVKIRLTAVVVFLAAWLSVLPTQAQDPAWLDRVMNAEDFARISIRESSRPDMQRATKFLAPVQPSADTLHTVYQNVNKHLLHLEFMTQEFPQFFGGMTSAEYLDLVFYRNSRKYFAGAVFKFKTNTGGTLYGFNAYHAPQEPLTMQEAALLHARLSETFLLRPLAYSPIAPNEINAAKQWQNPPFPVYFPEGLTEPEYEVYSARTNYGRVRLLTIEELEGAVTEGRIGWQDIVVIDQAPTDIETVVAGVVTGTRQGELSHVNVRSLRRGTPNAYVQDATQVFGMYKDQLVKLTLSESGYQVVPNVPLDEAEAWWSGHRPSLPPLPQPDDESNFFSRMGYYGDDPGGPDGGGGDVEPRAIRPYQMPWNDYYVRYMGGKAGNLAMMYQFLDPAYQVKGFAIPFHYYRQFMQSNTIAHPGDPATTVTYEEYLALLMQEERFRSDSAYRRERLESFVEYAREEGKVDPQLVQDLLANIADVYKSDSIKVRFRSSSNAEDDLLFSGAGLYESTSVCPKDHLDNDDTGPSHCDPTAGKERTVERGLKKVWMSLWLPKAFDEREYYQLDHERVRMGVLVTPAFPDEDANGVAFSGDPNTGRKDYFVVNVQKGDESVVQPGSGIVPEKDLIRVGETGVTGIERVRPSSIVLDGEWILTEAQLTTLGTVLKQIDKWMPVNTGFYSRKDILMDIEFKFKNGKLFVKQVRPLISAVAQPVGNVTEVTMIVPENLRMAGVFQDNRGIEKEYDLLSMLYLKSGTHSLPAQAGEYETADWVDRIEFSPQRIAATRKSGALLRVEVYGDETKSIQYTYAQTFALPDGRELSLTLAGLNASYEAGMQGLPEIRLTEENLSEKNVYGFANMGEGENVETVAFSSLTYKTLPLYKHTVEFTDGGRLDFYRRYQPPFAASGPANLVYAEGTYQGQTVRQGDYWKLVYAAVHHNWDEQFRVLFDAPIGDGYGIDLDTYTFDQKPPQKAFLLNADLQRIRELGIKTYTVEEVDDLPGTPVREWEMY